MPFVAKEAAPEFTIPGVTFTGLASPSRGARENAAWRFAMAAGTAGLPHRLTREETIIPLSGAATARIDGASFELHPGSALIVPPGAEFSLSNPHAETFEAVAVLPVGGKAMMGSEPPFTPPWAE